MIIESMATGFKNLFANKLRSALSMLGVILGVGTLVATMSIGEGTKQQILHTIEALGSNLITIDMEFTKIRERVQTPGITIQDVALLEEHSPFIELIAPLKTEFKTVSLGGKKLPTIIQGTDPDYEEIFNFYVERGRFITLKDIEESEKVCVVGADVAEKFETDDLLGETIQIENAPFLVVGVMERLGKSKRRTYEPDASIIMPISGAREISENPNTVNKIIIKAVSPDLVEKASDQIDALLTHFHNGHKDFKIWTQEEILSNRRKYVEVFKMALGSIAIVSLIIGGIGIMNILLASVNERIREIGIRKALGANPLHIMLQFLSESFILTISGGIIGVIIGMVMGSRIAPLLTEYLPQQSYEWKAITSTEIVVLAFVFAIVTGFIFGLYPAIKASRLDPSEALTYE
jgi:putative ABC transport system permease protein